MLLELGLLGIIFLATVQTFQTKNFNCILEEITCLRKENIWTGSGNVLKPQVL